MKSLAAAAALTLGACTTDYASRGPQSFPGPPVVVKGTEPTAPRARPEGGSFAPHFVASATVDPNIGYAGAGSSHALVGMSPASARSPKPEFSDRRFIEMIDRLALAFPITRNKRGYTITLPSDDFFGPGDATLNMGWRLDGLASAIAARSGRDVLIRVYTESLGNRAESILLSMQRAAAVRDYLGARGAHTEEIRVEGLGPASPVADDTNERGRAANRRIEILVGVERGGRR